MRNLATVVGIMGLRVLGRQAFVGLRGLGLSRAATDSKGRFIKSVRWFFSSRLVTDS